MNDYEILGVPNGSPFDMVKNMYRKLVLIWHPDKNKTPGASEKLRVIIKAYENIKNKPKGGPEEDRFEDFFYNNKTNHERYDEITSEGTIHQNGRWIPIEISIIPDFDTEKAYHCDVIVYKIHEGIRSGIIFSKEDTWVPKSMAQSPWWICTVKFEHTDKVANRRF